MNYFSLRTLIDDIMLIVRNNNISESEDFSRDLIASWILAYKAALLKKKLDEEKDADEVDESLKKTIGPLELLDDEENPYRRRTVEKIPEPFDGDPDNLVSVSDRSGCVIQFMHEKRRHYHYFRKYTFGELVCFYKDGYIYIEGLEDMGALKYIYVTGVFSDNGEDDKDEDEVTIPGWMIPDIKSMILRNELSFMLRMPSDDDNNATLDDIKPGAVQYPNNRRNANT